MTAHPPGLPAPHPVAPVRSYVLVYCALLALTALTVAVSLLDLGTPAVYVAMSVAVLKASLVAAYFMHLRHDAPFNTVVFASSLLFLAIFFVLTMLDLGSRDSVLDEEGNFALRDDQAAPAPSAAPASSVHRAP